MQARGQDFRKGGRIFHEVDLLRCRPKEQPPKAVASRRRWRLQIGAKAPIPPRIVCVSARAVNALGEI